LRVSTTYCSGLALTALLTGLEAFTTNDTDYTDAEG